MYLYCNVINYINYNINVYMWLYGNFKYISLNIKFINEFINKIILTKNIKYYIFVFIISILYANMFANIIL